jgi:TetR/AcrR family transcriptional regulator, tetracycline repressor protein
MVRPSEHSREEFLKAALAIVDAEGLEALTLRRLGAEVGVSYTAVYTYFENRDTLIGTLVNNLSAEIVKGVKISGTTPHEIILAIGIATRQTLSNHPLLVPAFTHAGAETEEEEGSTISIIATLLEQAGLSGKDLVLAYRAIESFVLGSTVFDLGAAPQHLSTRQRRYRASKHPDFMAVAKTDKSLNAHNEEAFVLGLAGLLTALGV